jgi:hypothetical protein
MRIRIFFISFFILLPFLSQAYTQNRDILLQEDFKDIKNWKDFYFPKIKKHTRYSIVQEGGKTYLKAESNSSASALIYKKQFNVYQYPGMRWQWKIENVYRKGNVEEKSGDDYPIRVYVLFKYDPDKAAFWQRITYEVARTVYGEYPPDSSLNYIWANRKDEKGIVTNTYANEAKMVILEAGNEKAGEWVEEEVNIVGDYRKAFGKDPPSIAQIAVMNDSDNTGESSVSYLGDIEVYK